MSRRSATTVTLSVRIPVQPGHSPKQVAEGLRVAIAECSWLKPIANQIIIKQIKRETVYL